VSEHRVKIDWRLSGDAFLRGRYSREHTWTFDGGVSVLASPSPAVVPSPWSNPAHVDPEEAFVASIASCHMLTFLHLAAKAGIEITGYADAAVGRMSPGPNGVPWINRVELRPRISFGAGGDPAPGQLTALHERAHAGCFIANSVRTEIVVLADPDPTRPD
jgi:organic hydroperoxide reductase OsmC/OhrA